MNKFLIVVFLIMVCISSHGKKYNKKKCLTIAFYNVENLFDLEDEPGKHDEEFTPQGEKNWTQERFTKKLEDISKVLSSINQNELPEVIGLCEVENKYVLNALVKTKALAGSNYGIVHYESPDFRGIDCALLYRPGEFKVIKSQPVKIRFQDDPNYVTRDILYVKGKTKNRQEFHIFVNHWPSRIGGIPKTEPKRMHVASILKAKVDSIFAEDAWANIVVMGDMNDEPGNKSIRETLGASFEIGKDSGLFNTMAQEKKEGRGTYNFRGNWNMLDNIIISSNLLFAEKGFVCKQQKGIVFREGWMEYKNEKGEIYPSRTYGGPNYYGGVSDHFPVYIQLTR